ncbi:MAG: WD40/YVTN/BNR-like repeat-containing protein [Acidithiobacillales bacterium]
MRKTLQTIAVALLSVGLAARAGAVGARTALGVDPKEPARAVLWEEGRGLFLTVDAGETWKRLQLSLRQVARVAIGENGAIFFATDAGFFRSEDGGKTFSTPAGLPRDGRFVEAASAGSAIFAISESGVYRSVDGGRNFRSAGVPGYAFHLFRVRWSPRFPSQVALVSPTLIYSSADGGETWRRLPASPDFDYGSLAWGVGDPPAAIAGNQKGVYRSTDGGATWKEFANVPPFIRGLWAPDPATDKYVLVATLPQAGDVSWTSRPPEKGLFRTLDGGRNWSGNLAPDGGAIADAVFAPGRTELLYVTTDLGGVFKSANKGDSWREIVPPAK